MKWLSIIGVTLTLLWASSLVADGPGSAAAPRAPTESLAAWEWYQELAQPVNGKAQFADFLLGPSVFDRARADLADLRLYDSRGREVPYVLRIRDTRDTQQQLAAREFNRAVKDDRSTELSLDLGEERVLHNQIEVVTTGNEFRRALRLEGSDDAKNWSTLLDKAYLIHFEVSGDKPVDVRKLSYPQSTFRYVRLRVSPYAGAPEDAPAITSAGVYHTTKVEGEYVTAPAALEAREPVPADAGPGSAWFITLANNELTPCESLSFEIGDEEFSRHYRLDVANPDSDEQSQVLAQGEWRRRARDKREPLVIRFPEVTARRLRLVVTDLRNPPLDITGVKFTAPAREIVYAPPADAEGPLRLYYGNPKGQAPGYDFATVLPANLVPPPVRTTLGERQPNPEYRPPPKPWTERWPWLVYVVLGTASLLLLGVLGLLGREAIGRHDAAAKAEKS